MCSKTFVKAIGKNKGALLIIQFKLVLDKPKAYQIYPTSTLRVMEVVLYRSNVRQLYNYKLINISVKGFVRDHWTALILGPGTTACCLTL